MDLPLALDATKEEVITALKFYGSATANMSKDLLEDTSHVSQELPVLADIIKQLIPLASNVRRLWSSGTSTTTTTPTLVNGATDRDARLMLRHLRSLSGAVSDLTFPVEFEDYEELLDDVYSNACGILYACHYLA